MTLKTKANLMVKADGSHEILIPENTTITRTVTRDARTKSLRLFSLFTILSLLVTLGVFCWWHSRRGKMHDHNIQYMVNGERIDDELTYNEYDETIVFKCGNTMDMRYGYNAFILQVDGYNDNNPMCLVDTYNYNRFALEDMEIDNDMMETELSEMENETPEAVVDETMWEPGEEITAEAKLMLPSSITTKCTGMKMHWIQQVAQRYRRDEDETGNLDSEPPREVEEAPFVPRNGVRPPPSLRVDEGESDHSKSCCLHCKRPYVSCPKTCVQQQTSVYPYYYYNCDHRVCYVTFPCSFWRLRANGQI